MDHSTISAEELALTCFRTGDELAWAEFIRRFNPLIARVVLRVARQWGEASPQAVDDLIQDTYLKICRERTRLLQDFKPTHSDAIYGYLKIFTANLVHDHFKAARSQKRGGLASVSSIDGENSGPNQQTEKSSEAILERNVLIQQIDACLQGIVAGRNAGRDRRVFWLYYRAGLAASAISALPMIELTTKGVESTLLRLTREVRLRLISQEQQCSPKDSLGKGIPPADAL